MVKLGLEMEMAVANGHSGASQAVRGYFEAMAQRKQRRGQHPVVKSLGGRAVSVITDTGESGLDNGFNHLESALGPLPGGAGALGRLDALVAMELDDVLGALAEEGAVVLNVAQHPDCRIDDAFYRAVRAPKPIYDDWVEHRGWSHWVGIDAKAQNGPTSAIPVGEAARALDVILALAPACIGLFANSPLEAGEETGRLENRLSIWPRMFATARHPGDRRLSRLPDQPFATLGRYFHWAYGEGTAMQTVPARVTRDYKGAPACRVAGSPSVLDFLAGGAWPAQHCDDGSETSIVPDSTHFEYLQFAPFLDARYRFRFGQLPSVAAIRAALTQPDGIEALFAECDVDGYIEGRVPGATFCDETTVQDMGWDAARTAAIAPSAVQSGLLGNLDGASRLVADWGWTRLASLRERAIVRGLADDDVHALAGEVLAVACAGLDPVDQPWLAYAQWTWQHRRTAADRLLHTWRSAGGPAARRLQAVARAHAVIAPSAWPARRSAA